MFENIWDTLQAGSETIQDWLDVSNYSGAMETFVSTVNYVLLVLAIIILLAIFFLVFRYPLRYIYHKARISYLGGMVWHEVLYEGQSNSDEKATSLSVKDAMSNIVLQGIGNPFHIYVNRPIMSIVLRKYDDGSIKEYIGVSAKHYDEYGPQIHTWASKTNASLEEVDEEDLEIHPNSPFTPVLLGWDTDKITAEPHSGKVGSVITSLENESVRAGTLIMSYEPMRESEEKMTEAHVLSSARMEKGREAAWTQATAGKMTTFLSNGPSRATFIAFSDDNSRQTSKSILSSALSAISTKPVRVNYMAPKDIHSLVGVGGLGMSLLLALFSYMGVLPWWIVGVCAGLSLLAFFRIPFLTDFWVAQAASNGAAAIPPFFRYSWRRKFKESRKRTRFNNQGDKFVGQPSCNEVIPMYETSIMEVSTMPMKSRNTTNISYSAVPDVALAKDTDREVAEYVREDDVIYLGMSAKTYSPVYRTLKDINYGIAFGGAAGSGKTNALRNDFYGMCKLSRKETGMAKDYTINPIWFETKTEDIQSLIDEVKEFKPRVFRAHDQNSKLRIALEGKRIGDKNVTPQTIHSNVNLMMGAFEAIWGDSFGPRSKMVASASMTVAMLIDKDGIESLGLTSRVSNPDRPNVIELMRLLIGGDPSINIIQSLEDYATSLRSLIYDEGKESQRMELGDFKMNIKREIIQPLDALINLHNQKDDVMGPLQNKLPVLLQSKGLFETTNKSGEPRREISIDRLFTYGGPVIADLTPNGSSISSEGAMTFTMLIHYILWQSLQQNCGGWAKQLKFTPLYVDELTFFTGTADEEAPCANIIGRVRDIGRSYGVSHNVGYQSFTALPQTAAHAVQSFVSNIFLNFQDPDNLDEVMRVIGEGTVFSKENITMFPTGVGIASMRIAGTKKRPFTIKTPDSEKWIATVSKSKSIMKAFDKIYDEEMEFMKEKRKVRKRQSEFSEQSGGAFDEDSGIDDYNYSSSSNEEDYGGYSGEESETVTWG